ncbi:MAG: TonB-dependent receptor [Verrucomicrobia bacterium]|nr:TonB-dependent receptor [Verrucomicrobiota bacterium]
MKHQILRNALRAGAAAAARGFSRLFAALAAVLLLLGSVSGGAAEGPDATKTNLMNLTIEQLMEIKVDSVVGASRYPQKVSLAPASVTILTDDDIKKHGYRTLADALRSVRGFYATSDRNYTYLGLRGFNRPSDYNSRFLLLVNGHRLNDNIYDSALIGNEFPLDLDLVDRVEVIRGPSSSVYGNNAFFGVINVITKQGRDFNGSEVSGSVGAYESYQGRFTYGQKFSDEAELLFSGTFLDSAGPDRLFFPEYNFPASNDGFAEKADYETAYKLFGSFRLGLWTLEGAYSYRKKGVPTGSYGTDFGDPRASTIDRPAYLHLTWRDCLNANWDATARAYFDYYSYQGIYPYAPVLNKDTSSGNRVGVDAQFTGKLFDLHTVTFGVELRDNLQQDQGNSDLPTGLVKLDDRRSSLNAGVHGQAEIALLTNLVFNAGMRYDYYEWFGHRANPRLGLIYAPVEPTTIKLLYGTAFRAPNVYESFYGDSGATQKGNPGLRPETIDTYEIAFEQKLPAGLQFNASVYRYCIEDLISQMTDPADGLLVFGNVGQVEARGVEVELLGQTEHGLRGRVSYAFQETEDKTTGGPLSNSPKHLAKLNVTAPLWRDRLFAGFELQYHNRVKTLAGNTAGSFWLANLTLFSHKLVEGVELSASLYNLFGTRYGYPGANEHLQDVIQQDGRSFRVKLTYRF